MQATISWSQHGLLVAQPSQLIRVHFRSPLVTVDYFRDVIEQYEEACQLGLHYCLVHMMLLKIVLLNRILRSFEHTENMASIVGRKISRYQSAAGKLQTINADISKDAGVLKCNMNLLNLAERPSQRFLVEPGQSDWNFCHSNL